MENSVLFVLSLVAPPTKRKEVVHAIRPLLDPTRVLSGCLRINFYQSVENPNLLTLVQEWQSQADLDYHLCSYEFKTLLAVAEVSSKRPEIKFLTIKRTEGLEVVQNAWA